MAYLGNTSGPRPASYNKLMAWKRANGIKPNKFDLKHPFPKAAVPKAAAVMHKL